MRIVADFFRVINWNNRISGINPVSIFTLNMLLKVYLNFKYLFIFNVILIFIW